MSILILLNNMQRKCIILLTENGPVVGMNGSIFYQPPWREEGGGNETIYMCTLFAQELGVLFKGQLICVLYTNRRHLVHHHRNPCCTALQREQHEFNTESHLSSQRAKHVDLTSCSIWQKKKES